MDKIKVLDCTLRDGGYCNQWRFGFGNIKKIVSGLIEAGVNIIECGFLSQKTDYNKDITKYTTLEEVLAVIPEKKDNKMLVCMINYGEYNVDDLPICDGKSIDGIRVAFHKKDLVPALDICKKIKAKGYKVFIQAMVSLNYSDEEFLKLIHLSNEISPYAFYIVDSFGVMRRKDLIRLFYMVEHNLEENITIGYHSHNNMQLAYSNAQALVDIRTKRNMILDSSIFGMGRGAGNLNTELFVEYLNDNIESEYVLKPLLTIIDEILIHFYQKNQWGYSLPNYLSATHNAHPNYAEYLNNKQTLTIENIDEIFSMMDAEKKANFDIKYIESLYLKYMATGQAQESHLSELKDYIKDKEILLIAPGKSSGDEKEKVIQCAKQPNVVSISVNFDYPDYDTNYIFLSNLRRFRELDASKRTKCIVTSNVPAIDVYLQTKYRDLLNSTEAVSDNASMMLIKFLINVGVKKIYIAGLDGYSIDPSQNFAEEKMNFFTKKTTFEAMNRGINKMLNVLSCQIAIEFITTPKYVNI